jgi:hypothetical protein
MISPDHEEGKATQLLVQWRLFPRKMSLEYKYPCEHLITLILIKTTPGLKLKIIY